MHSAAVCVFGPGCCESHVVVSGAYQTNTPESPGKAVLSECVSYVVSILLYGNTDTVRTEGFQHEQAAARQAILMETLESVKSSFASLGDMDLHRRSKTSISPLKLLQMLLAGNTSSPRLRTLIVIVDVKQP